MTFCLSELIQGYQWDIVSFSDWAGVKPIEQGWQHCERSQETRAMEPYPDPRAITRSPLLGDDCQSQIFFKDRLLFTNSWPLGLNKWVHSLYSFSPHQCEDAKAEAPVLWPPHAKSWLIGKDSDAGRDWGQKEKGTTEDEMAGWHDWLDGCESEWTPGVDDRQGGLACCDSWGCKELDTTERLNWTEVFQNIHCTYVILNIV